MAMMDTVKRLMAGRSAAVERGIDKAVDYLGRSTEGVRRQAEAAKARARALDPDRPDSATGDTPTRVTPVSDETRRILPADDTMVTPPVSPSPPPPPPPPASGGSALRGDLVDPPEGSPGT